MGKYTKLDLIFDNGSNLIYNAEYLMQFCEKVVSFLDDDQYMNSLEFAKKVMMSSEIQANNNIEGIVDDLESIEDVVLKKYDLLGTEQKRIVNIYNGYKFILKQPSINKDTLRELYSIISNGILQKHDLDRMGNYYREGPVIILNHGRLDDSYFEGMDYQKLDYYMNLLLEYVNSSNPSSQIGNYLKSQIMHFYFVYIHPYFDGNGRTSRTLAMWHLLNTQSYPYIIFNRAIAYNYSGYDQAIKYSRKSGDITLFLRYMLQSVLLEFEKTSIILKINENLNNSLSLQELQTIEYILSINGNITVKDFASVYRRYNAHKKVLDILNEQIMPLVDKGILEIVSETTTFLNSDMHNFFFRINPKIIDLPEDRKRILKIK